jgi:hypothetical protein
MRLSFLPLLLATANASPLRQPFGAPQNFHHESHERSLGKEATVTKTFKFKDDFFLRFETLPTAISPNEGVDELLGALESYGEEFRDKWVESLMSDLPDNCAVEVCSHVVMYYRVFSSYVLTTVNYYFALGNVRPNILHLQLALSRLL